MTNFYVYKYVLHDTGEVVYVGMSKHLSKRICEHKYEGKFQPYLDRTDIYVFNCANKTEMKCLEKLLINYHKPVLNVVDKRDEITAVNTEATLQWQQYNSRTHRHTSQAAHVCPANVPKPVDKDAVIQAKIEALQLEIRLQKDNVQFYKKLAEDYRKLAAQNFECYMDRVNFINQTLADLSAKHRNTQR